MNRLINPNIKVPGNFSTDYTIQPFSARGTGKKKIKHLNSCMCLSSPFRELSCLVLHFPNLGIGFVCLHCPDLRMFCSLCVHLSDTQHARDHTLAVTPKDCAWKPHEVLDYVKAGKFNLEGTFVLVSVATCMCSLPQFPSSSLSLSFSLSR